MWSFAGVFGRQEYAEIRCVGALNRTVDPCFLDLIRGLTNSGCIQEGYRQATQVAANFEDIPGSPRNLGRQRNVAVSDRIEQCGLSDIWRSEDRDLIALAQALGSGELLELSLHSGGKIAKRLSNFREYVLGNVFIGPVDCYFNQRTGAHQFVSPLLNQIGGTAGKDFQCVSTLKLGFGLQQVREAFDRIQIHPAGFERTSGELPRFREAAAIDAFQFPEDRIEDSTATMAVYFGGLLTREARIFLKQSDQSVVNS